MSKVATTSFISVALPFVDPIEQGINALAGGSGGLEIGLYKGFLPPDEFPTTGYYAIMRAPKNTIDVSKLRVDNSMCLVDDASGVEFTQYPYMIFTIEKSTNRTDWKEIPSVQIAYDALLEAQASGDSAKVNQALVACTLTINTCPDLLPADRTRILNEYILPPVHTLMIAMSANELHLICCASTAKSAPAFFRCCENR